MILGGAAGPVVVLGAGAVLVLVLDLFAEGAETLQRTVALVVLGLAAWASVAAAGAGSAFHGAVVGGPLTAVTGVVAAAGGVVAVALRGPLPRAGWGRRWSAYLALVLWSAAGMALLGGAGDLITLFLGVEVLSLALYALTAFAGAGGVGRAAATVGSEAGFKYFVLGGLGSGLLLYGAALQYAATGSLSLVAMTGSGALGLAGLLLLLVGLGFKLALAPFQLWTPEVYSGAPTPVAAFMSVGTKAAAFAGLARVLVSGPRGGWLLPLAVLGVASMFVGYLMAMREAAGAGAAARSRADGAAGPAMGQAAGVGGDGAAGPVGATPPRPGGGNLKRLLAYSGIANAGTLALALLAPQAWRPVAFVYLTAYAAATLGLFAAVAALEAAGTVEVSGLRGLAAQRPWLTAALFVCLLSLASVPPTGGFLGKLLLLRALSLAGHPAVAVLVAAATVFALYPYFRIAVEALRPAEGSAAPPSASAGWVLVAGLGAAVALAIGILPGPLLHG